MERAAGAKQRGVTNHDELFRMEGKVGCGGRGGARARQMERAPARRGGRTFILKGMRDSERV